MFQNKVNDFWYTKHFVRFLLWPFSLIFQLIAYLRRGFYQVKTRQSFPVPIIVIGNLTIGGAGKTPLVIFLANYLQQQGYRPGIVSRGYGGKQNQIPRQVRSEDRPEEVGDEAVLIKRHCSCPVFIGRKRVKTVEALLQESDCDLVICDDGLQHYALARDIEIVVIDGERRFGNGMSPPAGPLRERLRRLKTVDLIVSNGFSEAGEYQMNLVPHRLVNIKKADIQEAPDFFRGKHINAVAGIGNPERFFQTLKKLGYIARTFAFPDHFIFSAKDVVFDNPDPVVMTEKDAVKCVSFSTEAFWYLSVVAELEPAFIEKFMEKLSLLDRTKPTNIFL
jgi:tetraacyldisaccharide 4'-kinase